MIRHWPAVLCMIGAIAVGLCHGDEPPVSVTKWSLAADGFAVSLERLTPPEKLTTSDRIALQVRFRNDTDQTLFLKPPIGRTGVQIAGPDGQPCKPTAFSRQPAKNAGGTIKSVAVEPSEIRTIEFDLNELFDLTVPGAYRASYIYQVQDPATNRVETVRTEALEWTSQRRPVNLDSRKERQAALEFPLDPQRHPLRILEGTVAPDPQVTPPVREFREFRAGVVKRLLAILKSPAADRSFDGPVMNAMWILGELRSDDPEVIAELAKRLTYESYEEIWDQGLITCYPAAFALVRIGSPAKPALLDILIDDKSSTFRRRLAAWTLVEIELDSLDKWSRRPGDPEVTQRIARESARKYLDSFLAIDDLLTAAQQERLIHAKGYIGDYQFSMEPPQDVIPEYLREDPWEGSKTWPQEAQKSQRDQRRSD